LFFANFLPFKIIIVKLLFDNIIWIDCRQVNISGRHGVGYTSFEIRFHLRNDKKSTGKVLNLFIGSNILNIIPGGDYGKQA
jgi:hypothetical protein